MKYGSFQVAGLKNFENQLKKLQNPDEFVESCAKELAARLLAKVIKRTPVGQYPSGSGKTGGTLRRGWTGGKNAAGAAYANTLPVRHAGGTYSIEIINPVEYASYVEYGHRTRGGKGWVPGRFMMTISENELKTITPQVLEAKIEKYLGQVFK